MGHGINGKCNCDYCDENKQYHGSILRSLEKACSANDFSRTDGAYYTTITPFAKER
jgi:hypothetical protein